MLRLAALRLARSTASSPRLCRPLPLSQQLRPNEACSVFLRRNSSATPTPPEPRLSLTFTCTANECNHRSSHEFTRRAYERGIVIVTCPACKNRHLIADHIGWFKETEGTSGGKLKTVEDLLRARGERIDRGRIDAESGVLEYYEPPDADADQK